MNITIARNIKNETMRILKLRYRDFFRREVQKKVQIRNVLDLQFVIQTFIYRINEREKRNKFDKRKVAFTAFNYGDQLCN